MKIAIPFLGKTREKYLAEGIADFTYRLRRYTKVEIKTLKVPRQKGVPERDFKDMESGLLESCLVSGMYRVALDGNGHLFRSEELAAFLSQLEQRGTGSVAFLIGGPLGLAEEQLSKADTVLSLSRMTFTHEMARLLLLEQLYRAYTIKAGEQYHK